MSLKHAILGFLALKPLSGYDLKKAFDRSVQHFWPANQSQIYRTLAELDEQGLVEKEIIPREDRLDLKIYSISEAGRAELHCWLTTPLPPQDNREPFLIQVFFGGLLTDTESLYLLRRALQAVEERLAAYSSQYDTLVERPSATEEQRSSFLSLLPLEYGLASNRAAANWLRSAIERVQAGNFVPAELSQLVGEGK